MSTNLPERPARSKPKPAPSSGQDPVDHLLTIPTVEAVTAAGAGEGNVKPAVQPASSPDETVAPPAEESVAPPVDSPSVNTQAAAAFTPPVPPLSARPRVNVPEATSQMNSRVSMRVANIVAEVNAQTGMSKRAIIEEAIIAYWGNALSQA